MSRVYESLKEVVQETLQRNKISSITPSGKKSGDPSDLNGKMEELEEVFVSWIGSFKEAIKEREAVVLSKLLQAEKTIETLRENIAALETKLAQTEKIVHAKEATIKELEKFNAKVQELEIEVRNNKELLAHRDSQVNSLKSQLKLLKNRIMEMSSVFKQAEEVLLGIDLQDGGGGLSTEHLTKGEEKLVGFQSGSMGVTANAKEAEQETVSPKFLDRMTVALTHVLGPRASMIVRDRVAALGESTERFPKARVMELIEIVSQEIPDKNLRIGFREILDEPDQPTGKRGWRP